MATSRRADAACRRRRCIQIALLVLAAAAPSLSLPRRATSAVPGRAPSWRSDQPRTRLLDIPKRQPKNLRFVTPSGRSVDVVKRRHESMQHVLMKALVWALHCEAYPELEVERDIGDRFTPDVIALDELGRPLLWAECGRLDLDKVASLVTRFPRARLLIAKWGINPVGYAATVGQVVRECRTAEGVARPARGLGAPAACGAVDVVAVPADAEERFVTPTSVPRAGEGGALRGADGAGAEPEVAAYQIALRAEDLRWVRAWGPDPTSDADGDADGGIADTAATTTTALE